MAGSPFDKKGGGTATAAPAKAAAAPAAAKKDASVPDATNLGESKPVGKNDPFAAADPSGLSGYKMQYFLGQLILMHPTETGSMRTRQSTPEKPESEYAKVDVIPLTQPDKWEFINREQEVEEIEPWEIGERLDDIIVFQQALVREAKKALDNGTAWILGRMIKGERKGDRSAPYILVPASDEDKALYQEWRQAEIAKRK